jgi:DNA-binding MarR family transcriptional regulator
MTPDEVARLHADDRPGSTLIDYEEVSLPFYWLTLEAIVQERKPLAPVEEFALGAVAHGLDRPSDIAQYLGLESRVVDQALVSLLRDDSVDYRVGADGDGTRVLSITEQGSKALDELHRMVPAQKEIWVAFDRLTWKISGLNKSGLYLGRDLKDRGLREMRARLVRRPEVHELSVEAVNSAFVERGIFGPGSGISEQKSDLLSIRSVRRADRVYLPGVLLVYLSADGATAQYAVAIDGRISHEHGDAVTDRLESGRQGLQVVRTPASSVEEQLPNRVVAMAPRPEQVQELQRRVSRAREAAKQGHQHEGQEHEPEPDAVAGLQEQGEEAQQSLDEMLVRQLAVYEHPEFLRHALDMTRRRLLIISPWLKDGVVNQEFIDRLTRLAARGVRIHIGYGTGGDNADHPAAERRLRDLAAKAGGLTLCRLGNTHAKILITDDHLITTSFNWLSFKGDPARTFRQEEGTLVRVKEFVDQSYEKYTKQIEEACG